MNIGLRLNLAEKSFHKLIIHNITHLAHGIPRFFFIPSRVELMKKRDIKRFNKKALWLLEQKLGEDLDKYIEFLARKLMIEGRKTLKEGDIKDLKNALEKKEKEGFEI